MKQNYKYLFLMAGTMCLSFLGCSSKNNVAETTGQKSVDMTPAADITSSDVTPASAEAVSSAKDYTPAGDNVKFLGRTYLLGDVLWLSLSASGIEFTFTGTKADISLKGDNISIGGSGDTHYCCIGIYVNDELVYDDLLKEPKKTITAFESETEKSVTIRVLKLSETTDSTVGITNISIISKDSIKPTEANAHRIEFIGDSITCGFGVDDDDVNGAYTTATEDVTKAYAYQTAKALDADYSMFSISGYGILSGYTSNGEINAAQIIPAYYDTMGFSYGYFNNTLPVYSVKWDFNLFKPELIVINLGTNDNSYSGNDPEKQAEFCTEYITFLKHIREKNPNAALLCTLGIMGDTLYPSIKEAVKKYSDESGDINIYSMKFDVQLQSDGYGASWHPSAATHNKAAEKLTAEIKSIMGW